VNNLSDYSPLPPTPERFNIARYCLAAHAAERPDKTALIAVGGGQERRWRYGELDRAVRRLAGGLRRRGSPQARG
jgi:acyl-coenzyme A synthetase/AMP-(fatty) acid ligase